MKLIKNLLLVFIPFIFIACGGGSSSTSENSFELVNDSYTLNYSEDRTQISGSISFRATGFTGGFNWEEVKLKNIDIDIADCEIDSFNINPSSLTLLDLSPKSMDFNLSLTQNCFSNNLTIVADKEIKIIDLNNPKDSTYKTDRFFQSYSINYNSDNNQQNIITNLIYPSALLSNSEYNLSYEIVNAQTSDIINSNDINYIEIKSLNPNIAKINNSSNIIKYDNNGTVKIKTYNLDENISNIEFEITTYLKSSSNAFIKIISIPIKQVDTEKAISKYELEVFDFNTLLKTGDSYTFSYEILNFNTKKLIEDDLIDFITITSSDGTIAKFSDASYSTSKITLSSAKSFVNFKTFNQAGSSDLIINVYFKDNSYENLNWTKTILVKSIELDTGDLNTTIDDDNIINNGFSYVPSLTNSTIIVASLSDTLSNALYRSEGTIEHTNINNANSADFLTMKTTQDTALTKKVEIISFENQSIKLKDIISDFEDGVKVDVKLFNECFFNHDLITNSLSYDCNNAILGVYAIECDSTTCKLTQLN